jgi:tetratricopeptide (TPR) repeat protein
MPGTRRLPAGLAAAGPAAAGALDQALADFTESIRFQSSNRAAFAGRAQAQLALGDYRGATDDYSQAIRISPEATNYMERGHVYLVSGKR